MLRMNKDETAPEWLEPAPRLSEDLLESKRFTAPENPAVTRCGALGSMTAFYLLVYSSGQGFGSSLWVHEGLRYDLEKWSTQW